MKKQLPLNCETPLIDNDLTKIKSQTKELEQANQVCMTEF
jgi:hypothetical protein